MNRSGSFPFALHSGESSTKVELTPMAGWRIVPKEVPETTGLMASPLLCVVDDDEMLRESLPDLLREFGFAARAFSSGQEFLSSDSVSETRCLILDVAMPGMSGLDLHDELKRRGHSIPVIFITGQKDDEIRERAFRQGAVKFLYKPFSDGALLDAVNAALSGE